MNVELYIENTTYMVWYGIVYRYDAANQRGIRLLSSDDEYMTAIEWLNERGWL